MQNVAWSSCKNARMLEWSDLRIFLAIARAGTLVAAARELRVDHTTVGRRLAVLEDALSTRLFDRTAKGYVANAVGARVLEHATEVEARILALEREATGQDARLAGALRVTALHTVVGHYLLPRITSFRADYPDIAVALISDARVLDLSRREADIAIRYAKPKDPNLVGRSLATVGTALYASRAYIARKGRPRSLDSLTGHDAVTFVEAFRDAPEARWIESRGPRIAVRVGDPASQVAAVAAGAGIGLLECHVAADVGGLVRLSKEVVLSDAWWAVVHLDMHRTARVRAMLDFLSSETRRDRALLAGERSSRGSPTRRSRA